MQFNHDTLVGVRLARDLVNLPLDSEGADDSLERALRSAFLHGAVVDATTTEVLAEFTERLRSVFVASDTDSKVAAVNELLAERVQTISIEEHDGLPLHLHFASPDTDLTGRVTAMTAGGLAVFIVEAGAERLGVCARPGCEEVFADTSRNGRRSYCSARCGNLHAVHRYRDRRRSGTDG